MHTELPHQDPRHGSELVARSASNERIAQQTSTHSNTLAFERPLEIFAIRAPIDAARGISLRLSHDRLICLGALLLAACSFQFGERIEVAGGLGWDGQMYGAFAKDFPAEVLSPQLDAYHAQRILPSGMAYAILKLTGARASDANVIRAFGWMNVAFATLLAYFWCRIANRMQIGRTGKWLGFIGLFVNYALGKHAGYYPVMTDSMTIMLSMGMLCCYLESRTSGLYLLTLCGALTSPMLIYLAAALLLFPREWSSSLERRPAGRLPKYLLTGLACFYLMLGLMWAVKRAPRGVFGAIGVPHALTYLGLAIAVIFTFVVLLNVIDWQRLADWRNMASARFAINAATVALLLGLIKFGIGCLASRPASFSGALYGLSVALAAVAKPGIFLVAHAIYYGPLLVLALLRGKAFCRSLQAHGLGVSLAVAVGLLQAIDSESRHMIYLYPILVPFAVIACQPERWTRKQFFAVAGVALFASKFWLNVNQGPLSNNVFAWPDQNFMMSVGPYMTDAMFLLQGGLLILIGFGLYEGIVRGLGVRESQGVDKPAIFVHAA